MRGCFPELGAAWEPAIPRLLVWVVATVIPQNLAQNTYA